MATNTVTTSYGAPSEQSGNNSSQSALNAAANLDPNNLLIENDSNGYNELSSPQYQQYGQVWLNLLNQLNGSGGASNQPGNAFTGTYTPPLNSPQGILDTTLQGPNRYSGVTNTSLPNNGQALPDSPTLAVDPSQDASGVNALNTAGIPGASLSSLGLSASDPLNINSPLGGLILSDYQNSGKDWSDARLDALGTYADPAIEKQLGIGANDPNLSQYADAYVSDVIGTQGKQDYRNALQAQHNSGSFSDITGEIVGALAWALAGGGAEGLAIGAGAGAAEAAGEGAASASDGAGEAAGTAAGASSTSSDALDLYRLLQGVENAGSGIENKNPLSAVGSLVSEGGSPLASSLGVGPSSSDFGTSTFDDIKNAAKIGSGVYGLGQGIASGNPTGAIGGALGALSAGNTEFNSPDPAGSTPSLLQTQIGQGTSAPQSVPVSSPSGGYELGDYAKNFGNLSSGLDVSPFQNTNTNGPASTAGSSTQGQTTGNTASDALSKASTANNFAGLLNGIFGTNQTGQTSDSSSQNQQSFGTNAISTPVTSADAANIPTDPNFVDRQYYDIVDQIKQKFSRLGQSGTAAEQQGIQDAVNQQTQ